MPVVLLDARKPHLQLPPQPLAQQLVLESLDQPIQAKLGERIERPAAGQIAVRGKVTDEGDAEQRRAHPHAPVVPPLAKQRFSHSSLLCVPRQVHVKRLTELKSRVAAGQPQRHQ